MQPSEALRSCSCIELCPENAGLDHTEPVARHGRLRPCADEAASNCAQTLLALTIPSQSPAMDWDQLLQTSQDLAVRVIAPLCLAVRVCSLTFQLDSIGCTALISCTAALVSLRNVIVLPFLFVCLWQRHAGYRWLSASATGPAAGGTPFTEAQEQGPTA